MNITISAAQFSILHPLYNTKEDLVDAIKTWAKTLGFYLSKDKSEKDIVTFLCIMGGRQKLNANPMRTIKCDCPFKISGRRQKTGKWKALLTNSEHNHPAIDAFSVSQGRAISEDLKDNVIRLHNCLVTPRQIVSFLDLTTTVSNRDIYNIVAKGKKKLLNGRSEIQCLLEQFQALNCFFRHKTDENASLSHLFWAFDSQIQLFKTHSLVLMADCTYKTNRFKMPLLHFVGLSNVGKSFSVAFCFMKSETKNDYIWALKSWLDCFLQSPNVLVTDHEEALIYASSEVFPTSHQVLCIWHMNQNILKNCKPIFSDVEPNEYDAFYLDWNNLVYINSVEQFELEYQKFIFNWSRYPRAVSYIQRNIYPFKERFVSAFTSNFRHLGSVSTSRAEGLNGQIKRYIVSSREDLLGSANAIKLAVDNQINEIKILVEQEKITNYHRFGPLFSRVTKKISRFALDKVLEQLQLDRPLRNCPGSFNRVYG
jgi:hypothetical protein